MGMERLIQRSNTEEVHIYVAVYRELWGEL